MASTYLPYVISSITELRSRDEALNAALSKKGIITTSPIRFGTYVGNKTLGVTNIIYTPGEFNIELAAIQALNVLSSTLDVDTCIAAITTPLKVIVPVGVERFKSIRSEMKDVAEAARGRKLYDVLNQGGVVPALVEFADAEITALAKTQNVTIAEGVSIEEQIKTDATIEALAAEIATRLFTQDPVMGDAFFGALRDVVGHAIQAGYIEQSDLEVNAESKSQELDLAVSLLKKITLVTRDVTLVTTNLLSSAELKAIATGEQQLPGQLLTTLCNILAQQSATPKNWPYPEIMVLVGSLENGGSLVILPLPSAMANLPKQSKELPTTQEEKEPEEKSEG